MSHGREKSAGDAEVSRETAPAARVNIEVEELAPPPVTPRDSRGERLLKGAAFAVWAAFVVTCIGAAISAGLCCADDGHRAVVAKNIALGVGYATTLPEGTAGTNSMPVRFDPGINTGPPFILPCALAVKLFGLNDAVPGLVAIALWSGTLTFLLWRVSRRVPGSAMLLGVLVFLSTIVTAFPYHFEHWYAYLGEIFAASLVVAAHWIVAVEPMRKRWLIVAGIIVGLAIQTKYVAIFSTPGIALVLLLRLRAEKAPLRTWTQAILLITATAATPTVCFEVYKLVALGVAGYQENWRAALTGIRDMGVQSGGGPRLVVRVTERWRTLCNVFALQPWLALVLLIAAGWRLSRTIMSAWRRFAVGLAVSIAVTLGYWLIVSIGRPRYFVIGAMLLCFALAVPAFAAARWREQIVFALLAFAVTATGLPRVPHLLDFADRGLFKPSKARVARAELIAKVEEMRADQRFVLGTQWWATGIELEFGLTGTMNIRRLETLAGMPQRKLVLLNRGFADAGSPVLNGARERTIAKHFDKERYEAFEIR